MTPEGKVKQWLRTRMKAMFPTALHYAPPGGRFGKAGMPDDTWLIPTENPDICVYVAIESKVEGNQITALQRKMLVHIAKCGGVAAVMTGRDNLKLEKIHAEIIRRISVANEKSRASTIPTSEGDG